MIKNIIIVCTGNICRSPMGEVLLQARLANKIPTISVSSAGLCAMVQWPADPIAQELMQKKGLDLSHHHARQITSDMITASELILTMTGEQQKEIEKNFPGACGKVHRLGKWDEYDVIDPYKRPRVIFEHALALIEHGIDEWCQRLWS